ncbi:MAG: DUF167 domain-containing protein [Silvibacterium sp.]|nr:DUF167 domain-containing protein [Silvibacterium sp.]
MRITPRARRTQFTGVVEDGANTVFRIAVAAPPLEGRANEELISWLASVLDVPRSAIEVASGEHSRNKRIRVRGRTAGELEEAFKPDKSG